MCGTIQLVSNLNYISVLIFRILGLCLLQNELCPITLNRHVIKVLLGRKVSLIHITAFTIVNISFAK